PDSGYRGGKMDLCLPASLHFSTLIASLLDGKDPCLVRVVDTDCYRVSCPILLRPVVNLPHEYSLHCEPTFCHPAVSRDACEHSRCARSGTIAQRVCFVCDKVRVGSSHLRCRAVDGFLGSTLSRVIPSSSRVRRSKRAAVYRVHESLEASDDPRR